MANESENCVFPHCMADVGQEIPDPESSLMPGLEVSEARLVKQDLGNKIQDCHKQLLEFSSKNEVFLFSCLKRTNKEIGLGRARFFQKRAGHHDGRRIP